MLTFNFVVYCVNVRTKDRREISTDHRYSDFEALWYKLGEQNVRSIPSLPPKILTCSALDSSSLIRDRKRGLQVCLESLLADRSLTEAPDVQLFFNTGPGAFARPSCIGLFLMSRGWFGAADRQRSEDEEKANNTQIRSWRQVEKQLAEEISKLKLHNTAKSHDTVASILIKRNELKDLQEMTYSPAKLMVGLRNLGITCTIDRDSQYSDSAGGANEVIRGQMTVPISSLQKLVGLRNQEDRESTIAAMGADEAAAVQMALSLMNPSDSTAWPIKQWEKENEEVRIGGLGSPGKTLCGDRNRIGGTAAGSAAAAANSAAANGKDPNRECFMRLLTNGVLVTKYSSKRGKPKLKILFSADGGKTVSWQKVGMYTTSPAPGKSINIKDVKKVLSGCKTAHLKKLAAKMNHGHMGSHGRHFISIVTNTRTLDLECDDEPKHARLLEGLRRLVADSGGGRLLERKTF
jgi:hypothetical protein